ncbi:pilus assembly protein TadE [Novosphingobium sp. SL115]|uniref:TadE/TadG family type IV pilus assembly protein n=1 Tax=Novosphingobium sp. SL115 TaxID=2995150 RepID=UPI002275BF08|nr:pilus assembly protein TadE [Novosphingobium sp. SL115]MCY1671182.1 pilus assembly protein TadE [Novosphingobium sp. SL115]
MISASRWIGRICRKILADSAAISTTEFAVVLPVFMTLGMYGTEISWMTIAEMQASQVAISLADNASRLGQTDNSGVTPTISDEAVQNVLTGALLEGQTMNMEDNGRVILSSLETHPVTGKQYIHWQECSGELEKSSKHGKPDLTGTALAATMSGLNIGGTKITAPPGTSVMVAEVWYQYHGLFGSLFVQPFTMYQEATIIVRDDRNTGPGLNGKNSKGC